MFTKTLSTIALVALVSTTTTTAQAFGTPPSGEYLDIRDQDVWQYQNLTGTWTNTGHTNQVYTACEPQNKMSSSLSRCGWCKYVPQDWPGEGPSTGWVHPESLYTHGACANVWVKNHDSIIYRADVRIRQAPGETNRSFSWTAIAEYHQVTASGDTILNTTIVDARQCVSTDALSNCDGEPEPWTPEWGNYPTANVVGFGVEIKNRTGSNVAPVISAWGCR